MKKVGFTTTIPLEILIAAKKTPVDLNNIFITHPANKELLERAENDGFPRNTCSWIKGIYGVVRHSNISEVIAVTQGDCSNAQALMETLQFQGIKVIPFFYPYDRDPALLSLSFKKLMEHYEITEDMCLKTKADLDEIRRKVHFIDELTWKENIVSGEENHYFQVCTSDMNQDPRVFENELGAFLNSIKKRQPFREEIRLGYIGVPPVFSDLYSFIETMSARVVFNEMQRQFSMPYPATTLLDQYLKYTYPYDIFTRIADIKNEVKKRKIDGLIHYVQSFCFRQIEDSILKKSIDLPIVTIEGDQPSTLDSRNKMKIEVFIEMLRGRKNKKRGQ
jgi:benzoyl-CoA reductase/2-hydroxyglutaryl-CoA dehydratase subunit BcrC/BadD/HgdB